MGNPTRFPNGVSTQKVTQTLANFPLPDPSEVCEDFEEFNQYVAGDWTVTNTTSHATIGLVAGAGGVLGLAGGASTVSTDVAVVQATPLNVNFSSTQQVWGYFGLKSLSALNEQLLFGVTSSNAALAPTDGIYFAKAAASAQVDLVVRKSSTSTTQAAVATLVADTYTRFGFYYNGKDAVDVFVNDVKVASVTTLTNLPTATALGLTVGAKASATAPTAGLLSVDFAMSAQDRAY